MSTGVGGALKRRGGDTIEFQAVRQAPVSVGDAVVTGAGTLAAKWVVHAVSLDRDRRTSASAIEAAVRSTMARARELGAASIAFPALGTGVGGFPLDEAARVTVETVRDEVASSPGIDVVFALRGAAAYEAFQAALARTEAGGAAEGTEAQEMGQRAPMPESTGGGASPVGRAPGPGPDAGGRP